MVVTLFHLLVSSAWQLADLNMLLAAAALIMGTLSLGIYHRTRRDRQRFITALNNMSQGLCMFDANARLILCNDRYLQMYNMSPTIVMPGCSLRRILEHRKETGSFIGDVEQYLAGVRSELS